MGGCNSQRTGMNVRCAARAAMCKSSCTVVAVWQCHARGRARIAVIDHRHRGLRLRTQYFVFEFPSHKQDEERSSQIGHLESISGPSQDVERISSL
eukprot:1900045-Prymnesium_polylepis.1